MADFSVRGRVWRVLAAIIGLGLAPGWAAASNLKEVALVIGNGGYQNVTPLNNPVNDANLVGASLQRVGFQLVGGRVQTNLNRAGMLRAIADLGDAAQNADVVVIYYAGHGVQVKTKNYLIPTDMVQPRSEDLLAEQAVSLDSFIGVFKSLPRSKINLLMLDACRDNPFPKTGTRGLAVDGGLAYVSPEGSNIIWFATQPGTTAADGAGQNGPYAQAIAQMLQVRDVSSNDFFDRFGSLVVAATNGQQTPTVSANPAQVKFIFNGPDGRGAFQAFPTGSFLLAKGAAPSASRGINEPVDDQAAPAERPEAAGPEPRQASLQRVFGAGFAFSAEGAEKTFAFGMTLDQVNGLLDGHPVTGLAEAGEYANDHVEYFWRHFSFFPTLSTAFVHLDANPQCIDPNTQIVFFFKAGRLFHMSIRFVKSAACPAYDWLKPDLMGDQPDHVVLTGPLGPTDLILHDREDMTVLEITQRGVADDAASIFN